MNLKEFANVDSLYRDLDTGHEVPWREYMHRIIGKLGIENIKPYVPFSLDELKEKLKHDIHLNNTPLAVWDGASGFSFKVNRKTQTEECVPLRYGMKSMLKDNGITCYSPSECVCILKETARMLIEEVNHEQEGNH